MDLPLLNLGWTFALSSKTPQKFGARTGGKPLTQSRPYNWIPAAFSFRRYDSKIPWGNTSMHAQLSLLMDGGGTPGSNPTPLGLGTMKVVLAHTPSAEVPLTKSCTLSSLQPAKVSLTVTISECPFANGLFQAVSSQITEAGVHVGLIRQYADCLLSRSLATGKLFDVKFLTRSTRSTSGNTGQLFQTYASLSVLEKHVNLSSGQ